MDQAVGDMQADLVKVRQSYAEVFAGKKRLAKEIEEGERQGKMWYERAEMALGKGEEELAREGEGEEDAGYKDATGSKLTQTLLQM